VSDANAVFAGNLMMRFTWVVATSSRRSKLRYLDLIKLREKQSIVAGQSLKFLNTYCQFKMDTTIAGIAPFKDQLLILAHLGHGDQEETGSHEAAAQKFKIPEIRVVNMDGITVERTEISVKDFESFNVNDYHLEHLASVNAIDAAFYLVSPQDIILIKPRDLSDHIKWLLDAKMYGKALKAVENAGPESGLIKSSTIVDIGMKYIKSLFEMEQYAKAAAYVPKVLRDDSLLWHGMIQMFISEGKISVLIC
jgi:vacuolar protein sorting-associated protein 41